MEREAGQVIDERFSGLPGIAHGQQTVFETDDLPESDQHSATFAATDEHISKNVELIQVDPAAVFLKLQARSLGRGGSMRPEIAEAARGYSVFVRDIEGKGEASIDCALEQRKRRIRADIDDLRHDLLYLAQFRGEQSADERDQTDADLSELVNLSSVLDTFKLDEIPPTKPPNTADGLANVDDTSKSAQPSRFNDAAAARLTKLENAIGSGQQLRAWSHGETIVGSVSALKSQMSLLDQENIVTLEQSLSKLAERAEAVAKLKRMDGGFDVGAIAVKLRDIEQIAEALPEQLDKMRQLQATLRDARALKSQLDELCAQQDALAKSQLATEIQVEKMLRDYPECAKAVQQRFDQIESRAVTK